MGAREAEEPGPSEVELLAEELTARGARGRTLAIVLGSGLGPISERLGRREPIEGVEFTHLPKSRVNGHAGTILLGELAGVPVLVQSGRVHLYEGWSPFEVTRAVRAYARIGVRALVLTNAAGGLVPSWRPGSLMRLTDHLNLQGSSALFREEAGWGNPYDGRLGATLDRAALRAGVELERGVYAGLLGPNYETPAEIRALSCLGAEAVGMSTVAEACAAYCSGMRVAAIACIANPAAGLGQEPLCHEDVLAVMKSSAYALGRLLEFAAPELAREVQPTP